LALIPNIGNTGRRSRLPKPMKNTTQEERDAFERKLIDEVEKDGIKSEAEAEAQGTTKTKTQ